MSKEHAIDTGKHLSDMSPDYASALTIMVVPGTELDQNIKAGNFEIPDKFGLLTELKLLIENLNVKNRCFFKSNHASNYVPIRANMPEQKDEVVNALDEIISSRDDPK